jgi:hypothetical protein
MPIMSAFVCVNQRQTGFLCALCVVCGESFLVFRSRAMSAMTRDHGDHGDDGDQSVLVY